MRLPLREPVTPRPRRTVSPVDAPAHPPVGLVGAARRLADDLLRPEAERIDVDGVPRSHVDALGRAGLLGLTAPIRWGGAQAAPAVVREVTETLAAADCSTWFVWTQHHTPVRTLIRGDNPPLRDQWLPELATGRALAGVAYTHLRRPGRPALSAERSAGGWRITGDIAWLTSWGLADVFLLGAQHADDVVWVLLPLTGRRELTAVSLALMAMGGTSTVRVHVRDLAVADDEVVLVEPLTTWRVADAAKTVDVNPAVFGVTREAVARLRRLAADRDDPDAAGLAQAVDAELTDLRASAYDLVDSVPAGERVADRLAVRAAAHVLACRATAGLLAAGAGRAIARDAPAQRLAREALFLLVQGQTPPVRAATLRRFAG